ncbi:MAG: hypothetical protein ACI3XM_08695, partial [Eubacteriales bacterium]
MDQGLKYGRYFGTDDAGNAVYIRSNTVEKTGFYLELCDAENNVLKKSQLIEVSNVKQTPTGSIVMIDETWCAVHSFYSDQTTIWLVDHDLNLHGSFDLPDILTNGYRREDGKLMLVCADTSTHLYDPETNQLSEVVLYRETEASRRADTVLYSEDAVYFIDYAGITVQREGKETFLCDFAKSYYAADQFAFAYALPDDRFLVYYQDRFTGEEYPAIFVPVEEEQRPVRTVLRAASVGNTVGNNMIPEDHDLITNSIAYFNRTNEEYVIELTDYDVLAQYAADGSYIQASTKDRAASMFEQELMKGAEFDIYLIGNTYKNRDNLEEKGLFADLSAFADQKKLIACVRDALERGGEMTAIPFTVTLSTLVTTTDTLKKGETFTYEKLYEIMDGLGEGEALFEAFVRDNMLDIALYDFVDTEKQTCSYDSEAFIRLMEFMRDFKNSVPQTALTEIVSPCFSNAYGVLNIGGTGLTMYGDVITPFAEGKIKFIEINITQPETLPMLYYLSEVTGKTYNLCGYPSVDGGSIHMETDLLMSVGKNSAHMSGAKAYLSLMLSETVQTEAGKQAFPVLRSAVENRIGWGYQYYKKNSSLNTSSPYQWKTELIVFFMESSTVQLPPEEQYFYNTEIKVLKPEHDALLSYV